jgi:hypothetical protein
MSDSTTLASFKLHPAIVRMLAKRNAPPAPPAPASDDFINFELVTHLSLRGHLGLNYVAARVARVAFDGESFEEMPLERIGDERHFDIVLNTMEDAGVLIESRTRTPQGTKHWTYFGIKDAFGNLSWAGPGDLIVAYEESPRYNQLMVIPRALSECFLECQKVKRHDE